MLREVSQESFWWLGQLGGLFTRLLSLMLQIRPMGIPSEYTITKPHNLFADRLQGWVAFQWVRWLCVRLIDCLALGVSATIMLLARCGSLSEESRDVHI
jgi:hypothetical protein